jgi:hypothetical protein
MSETIDTAAMRQTRGSAYMRHVIDTLCDEVDRLRLGVDYTDEGSEIVLRHAA